MSPQRKPITYRDAGVDIDRGNRLVERIKPLVEATYRPEVMGRLGGFGALVEVPVDRYRRPVLVSGADGVGTKLKLAIELGRHDTIGIDLVAMCVNDVLVLGAEPLYFLDYLATGRLDEDVAYRLVAGIARGCELAGAALVGGETAEMPGLYADSDYDLAGFCVGIVERDRIIDASAVTAGDVLVGLASSGAHSNGYSLIRKVIAHTGVDLGAEFHGSTLGATLLEPTRIYASSVRAVLDAAPVRAIAHITGGGLTENIPRVLPDGTRARLHPARWPRPAIFEWLQAAAELSGPELYRTFNCGIGMVLCVTRDDLPSVLRTLERSGESAWEIGVVENAIDSGARVVFDPAD